MELKGKSLSAQLRSALRTSGQSMYQIHKTSGVDEGTLSKFRAGKAGLSLESIDRLVRHLGLRLTQDSARSMFRAPKAIDPRDEVR